MVYAGYFFGQYPCGWLIGRFAAQKVLAISIMLWGFTVIIMTQSRTYSSACKFGYRESVHRCPADECFQWLSDVSLTIDPVRRP